MRFPVPVSLRNAQTVGDLVQAHGDVGLGGNVLRRHLRRRRREPRPHAGADHAAIGDGSGLSLRERVGEQGAGASTRSEGAREHGGLRARARRAEKDREGRRGARAAHAVGDAGGHARGAAVAEITLRRDAVGACSVGDAALLVAREELVARLHRGPGDDVVRGGIAVEQAHLRRGDAVGARRLAVGAGGLRLEHRAGGVVEDHGEPRLGRRAQHHAKGHGLRERSVESAIGDGPALARGTGLERSGFGGERGRAAARTRVLAREENESRRDGPDQQDDFTHGPPASPAAAPG